MNSDTSELIISALRIEIAKTLERIGNKLVRDAKLKLRDDKKYASRDLLNSITYEVIQQNATAFGVKFGTPISYAPFVHEGRVPGRYPPYDKATKTFPQIESWLTKKRIFTDMPLRSAAFLVARKIKQKGIDPYPFLRLIVAQNEPWIKAQLKKVMSNVKTA